LYGFVAFDRLALANKPVDLVHGVFLVVNRVYAAWDSIIGVLLVVEVFVEEDAVGGATATDGEDGIVVFQAVDFVDYEAFANGELAANIS